MRLPDFERYYGVDFSGAKKAGDAIWVAEVRPRKRGLPRLVALDRMTTLCGTADRGPALGHLVGMISASSGALWGCDFPFGLPLELFPKEAAWDDHFTFLGEWGEEAYDCGLECVRRATELFQRKHIRRATDSEAKAPFDAFHYRMIYQTFYGMRDVVDPLRKTPGTAVLPFQYRKLPTAKRVVVECCPGSVLKREGVPHQNYKQPAGGPLTRRRKLTRHAIFEWLDGVVVVEERFRRVMMRNPGGDAIDAVIAAVGAARAVDSADHRAIARHDRYRHEGHLYV
ncbi:MAG: DUF429 domain-containing protein [Gemmataceae bacterium]|nr:DUF429 domain-containing protein [Gemmataceae bacterium]